MLVTNFENYLTNLDQYTFINSMILNCDGCPVEDCELRNDTVDGMMCEDTLTAWCEEDIGE